uniref:Uncharacterized protein LOC104250203 n=1 Tax=Nicotiana sylvestris TaxID=4096 RepID=A0A1U7YLY7_NICSY|nr:PREDICTED: uncharacterized protein LOC104250203 [Nicotiana sylvestris]
MQYKYSLQTFKKGDLSIDSYIEKIHEFADCLHSIGRGVDDPKLGKKEVHCSVVGNIVTVCPIFRARGVAVRSSSGKVEFELDGPDSSSKTECTARGSKYARNIRANYD